MVDLSGSKVLVPLAANAILLIEDRRSDPPRSVSLKCILWTSIHAGLAELGIYRAVAAPNLHFGRLMVIPLPFISPTRYTSTSA